MSGRVPISALVAAVAAIGVSSCGGNAPPSDPPASENPFLAAILRADRAHLYEGLPPRDDPGFAAEARRAAPIYDLTGEPFYPTPLPWPPDEAAAVAGVLADPGALQVYRPGKKCGGFHADYAVEWEAGGGRYQAVFCFGCGEVILLGPGLRQEHDLSPGAQRRLQAVLGQHRANWHGERVWDRPPP